MFDKLSEKMPHFFHVSKEEFTKKAAKQRFTDVEKQRERVKIQETLLMLVDENCMLDSL